MRAFIVFVCIALFAMMAYRVVSDNAEASNGPQRPTNIQEELSDQEVRQPTITKTVTAATTATTGSGAPRGTLDTYRKPSDRLKALWPYSESAQATEAHLSHAVQDLCQDILFEPDAFLPKPLDLKPFEVARTLISSRNKHNQVVQTEKTPPLLTQVNWQDQSKLIGKGPDWVHGNWHLDWKYDRRNMVEWINTRIERGGSDYRSLCSDLQAAAQLADSYDPVLAGACNLAAIRIAEVNRLPALIVAQAWYWFNSSDDRLNQWLSTNNKSLPLEFLQDSQGLAGLEALQPSTIARCEDPHVRVLRAIIAGRKELALSYLSQVSKAPLKEHYTQALEAFEHGPVNRLANQKPNQQLSQALNSLVERVAQFKVGADRLMASVTNEEQSALCKSALETLGPFSDWTANLLWAPLLTAIF